jgi:hypothetical protein
VTIAEDDASACGTKSLSCAAYGEPRLVEEMSVDQSPDSHRQTEERLRRCAVLEMTRTGAAFGVDITTSRSNCCKLRSHHAIGVADGSWWKGYGSSRDGMANEEEWMQYFCQAFRGSGERTSLGYSWWLPDLKTTKLSSVHELQLRLQSFQLEYKST